MSFKAELIALVKTEGVKKSTSEIMGLSKTSLAAAASVAAIGTAAYKTATAINDLVVAGMTRIDQMKDEADLIGISISKYQLLSEAAKIAGMSQDTVGSMVKRLGMELGQATAESTNAGRALEALGLKLDAINQMSPDKQFEAITKAIKEQVPEYQQAAVYAEFFGKEGAYAAKRVAEESEKAEIRIKKFGGQIDDLDASSVERMSESIDDLKYLLEATENQLAKGLAPQMEAFVKTLTDMANDTHTVNFLTAVQKGFIWIGLAVAQLGVGLKRVGVVLVNDFLEMFLEAKITVAKNIAELVNIMNLIPGINLDEQEKNLQSYIEQTGRVLKEVKDETERQLMEPLPMEAFDKYEKEAIASNKKVEEEKRKEIKKTLEYGKGGKKELTSEEIKKVFEKDFKTVDDLINTLTNKWLGEENRPILDLSLDITTLNAQKNQVLKIIDGLNEEMVNKLSTETFLTQQSKHSSVKEYLKENVVDAYKDVFDQIKNKQKDLLKEVDLKTGAISQTVFDIDQIKIEAEEMKQLVKDSANFRMMFEAKTFEQQLLIDEERAQKEIDIEKWKNNQIKKLQQEKQAATMATYQQGMSDFSTFASGVEEINEAFGNKSKTQARNLFFATKSLNIAVATMQLQSAIMSALADWSSVSTAERFAKAAAIGAAGGTLLSQIASAKYPGRAQGGSVGKGTYLVGERGPELIRLGSTGRVYNNSDTKSMMSNSSAPTGVTIINHTTGRIDQIEQKQRDDGELVLLIRETMKRDLNDPNSDTRKQLNNNFKLQRQF